MISKDYPCLYVLIVVTAGPEAYFKIGYSTHLAKRVSSVQVGCPLPINRVLWMPTFEIGPAIWLESALHERFRRRQTSGEWFMFDITSEADKRDFRDGCAEVIRRWREDWAWQVFDENDFQNVREMQHEEGKTVAGRLERIRDYRRNHVARALDVRSGIGTVSRHRLK
jgi:hypothetical protein